MSFGQSTGGGFGSFGQNNTTTSSGFGGFGGTGSAFGSTNNNATSGFGANSASTGGGLFGSTTAGGFGSGSTAFGAKPAFGGTPTTGAGGIFGTTANAGNTGATTGGFGSTAFGGNTGGFGTTGTTGTTGGFGTAGSSLFGGGNKGFGTTTTTPGTTTGTGLFGQTGTAGFGSTGFGAGGAVNNPGIGTNVGDPPGTAGVPFQATIEKEANNPAQSNAFQNILFMDAYKRWSSEELRLADYNQGRRHGTAGGGFGQGAFSSSTTTGTAFGSTPATTGGFGGGLFGTTGTTGSAFGTQNATSGFGSTANTGGGLFKPATTGGIFGGTTTTTPAATTGTGMFGGGGAFGGTNTGTSTGAFGANTATTGGGLFGANANKPAGFGFGTTQPTTGTGTGMFGTTNTTTTPGFGTATTATNTGGGLFGGNTGATTGGLFGQQPAATSAFGTANQTTGGGLFGANAQKPAGTGLFGSTPATNTGSTLFGSTGGAFGGNAANTTASTGLFGKPATTGTGLFGSTNTAQTGTTGSNIFGASTQAQQSAQGSGLFGGLGQNQAKPSVFGTTQTTGTGLFGQSNTGLGTGLFGASMNQPQQTTGFGSSVMNNSQNAQQNPSFSTSITDLSAYGAQSLFSNGAENQVQNPGPLATPLSGQAKTKSRSILPMYKLSPANATRFITPQKRGFGFSYSTYGTPNSPSSVASTPGGLGQSLLGGSVSRGLSKSISTSSLRRSYNVSEDSILLPGAFSSSTGPRLLGSGNNHKKLVINRELRSSDLFSSPSKDKPTAPEYGNPPRKLAKRVSFDTSPDLTLENGSQEDGVSTPRPQGSNGFTGEGFETPTRNGVNGTKPSSAESSAPEMEQVKGKELAIVPEESSPVTSRTEAPSGDDSIGRYWMHPTKEEIEGMNRVQRQKVADFMVGRENVGSVRFKVPVDLSNIDLDNLFGEIVILEPRSATVYPVLGKKPPVGKGLNVPAQISLEQSWPRARDRRTPLSDRSGQRVQKHIERLKKIENTTFESYDTETGVWVFSVEHFTTYGLDDDEEDETETYISDGVAPSTSKTLVTVSDDAASPEIYPDDTFEFRHSRKVVPGAFDEAAMSDEDEGNDTVHEPQQRAPSEYSEDNDQNEMSYEAEEEIEQMAGYEYSQEMVREMSAEEDMEDRDDLALAQSTGGSVPAGIMRAKMRALKKSTAPTRIEVAGGNDWTQILQESVRVPRTVDRMTLRALNESGAVFDLKDRGSPEPKGRAGADGAGFSTSIDLMKSLFDQAPVAPQPVKTASSGGFMKWPYPRRSKEDGTGEAPVPRPRWGPDGGLVTVGQEGLARGNVDAEMTPIARNTIEELDNFIHDLTNDAGPKPLGDWAYGSDSKWKLASIMMESHSQNVFPTFWHDLLSDVTEHAVARAQSPEEKAMILLAGNRMDEACQTLLASGNFRLANLVVCIGTQAKDIRAQVKDWRESNVLSEFSEPIRALYELLGGNACVCAGTKGVPVADRVNSFVISERFGLDWMQAFGLRLFCTAGSTVEEAVLSFQMDIDQGREADPAGDPLWELLKVFATRTFNWAATDSIGWLLIKVLMARNDKGINFGSDVDAQWNRACVSFATTLSSNSYWVYGTVVLSFVRGEQIKDGALLDQLGRHAHLLGSPRDSKSAFSLLLKTGTISPPRLWEAKALHFRSRQDAKQEFLSLLQAKNYSEANNAFLERLGPQLVNARDYERLFRFASLLYKARNKIPGWNNSGAIAYLLFPMVRDMNKFEHHPGGSRLDNVLFEALPHVRKSAASKESKDLRRTAAAADMAEDLIRARGNDPRLYQLLPEDVRERYYRDAVVAN